MLSDYLQTVDWSRAQFAMTAIYHWLFVPLTLGLSIICAIMETIYYRTGDPFWKRTAKFWMRLFGINFAIGVATGLILEFEFGTNWSNYSHFVGDIFGAPLAIEGILAFFLAYDRTQFGILAASLIGVTSLIFNAKGNPFGQLLMVCFSALYGIISFSCGYYGEMATYLGMTAPMAVFALVSWLRNPYDGNRAEVQVKRLERRDAVRIVILTVAVTAVFYFILAALHTNRLIPSTLSVATSFLAAFLTFQRSALFAAAYAANDLVLVCLLYTSPSPRD